MAKLIIKKYQNKNSESNGFGKWYGRLVPQGTLQTDAICRHIARHGSIYTSDVVKGVVEKFVNCFEELLLQGYKLKLEGLGTFYLTISTSGAATPDDFTLNNVKVTRVRFLADQSRQSEYTAQMLKQKAEFCTLDDLVGESQEKKKD